MKTIFFSLVLILLSVSAYSQSKGVIRLYGFKQFVSGGKAPELSEDGTRSTSTKQGRNYFMYAASTYRIYPAEIWIEGIRCGVSVKPITKTPVEYSDEANIGSPRSVLVPATSKKIIQLIPISATAGKHMGTMAKSLSATNELVVVYKQGGKFYYNTLKSLSAIESAAME